MRSDVVVGIAGLLLSVLTFFAGEKRASMRRLKDEKKKRIKEVFDKYMDFRKTNRTGGYDGLLKAGAATLQSDEEIRELCTRIEKHGERSPLGNNKAIFNGVDLKELFEYVVENKINFFKTTIEDIIKSIRAR